MIEVSGPVYGPTQVPIATGKIRITTIDSISAINGSRQEIPITAGTVATFQLDTGKYMLEYYTDDDYWLITGYVDVPDTATGTTTVGQLLDTYGYCPCTSTDDGSGTIDPTDDSWKVCTDCGI